jgi:hypothetical protein
VVRREKSQAVVDIFQRKDKHVIVVGWLRSSSGDEVADRSGMAMDRRAEVVAAQLPCAGARVAGFYNAEGAKVARSARVQHGMLRDIHLSGSKVFVAELSCHL